MRALSLLPVRTSRSIGRQASRCVTGCGSRETSMWFASWCLLVLVAPAAPARSDALLAKIPDDMSVASGGRRVIPKRDSFGTRSTLAWSADGKTVAYAARRGDDWFPVVGSKIGEAYDGVTMPVLAGGHAFFAVVLAEAAQGTVVGMDRRQDDRSRGLDGGSRRQPGRQADRVLGTAWREAG